uniref:Testis expressed 44 n=1 Tax=Rousettus aegyptiacus TaxID=9407 RepID=A0A7J8JPZ2_ROUAE|nr:testis expressed 44 [Rousettus aegyptiacus]
MTTVPSEEATATSISTHGDSGSSESPTLGSQSQASVRAEVPVASSTAVTAEWQDVQVSIKPTTSEAVSLSGDKDKHEDTAGFSREPRLAHLAPGPPQMSMSLQNQARDGPVQDARMTQSFQIFQHGSLVNEETPQTAGVPDGEQELARNTPSAVVQSPQSASIASIAEADIQLDTLATGTTEAVEEPEHPEALHPDSEALPLAEFQHPEERQLGHLLGPDSRDPLGHALHHPHAREGGAEDHRGHPLGRALPHQPPHPTLNWPHCD